MRGEHINEVGLGDLLRFTDLARDEIDVLAPSEIDALVEVAREVNARFFAMRDLLAARMLSSTSSAASPP